MSAPSGRMLAWWPFPLTETAIFLAIVLVYLVTGALDPNHTYFNAWDASAKMILRNAALLGIVALGASVVIIVGGIDLSSGSMIAFSATTCALIMMFFTQPEVQASGRIAMDTGLVTVSGLGIFLAMVGAVLSGLMVGTLHTWMVTSIRLPPFVATLATLVGLRSFARGMCLFLTKQYWGSETEKITVNTPFFGWLRENNVWISSVVFLVLALVTWVILSRTVLGRHIYAIGGNEEAARLSGIRTENVKWFAYCFSGLCSAIAGIFLMADNSTVQPALMAQGFELNAIASAVVGGCSLQGGIGTVLGTALGALFLRVVIDAVAKLIKAGADVYQGMIVGIIVVVAVTSTQFSTISHSSRQFFPGWRGIWAIPTISLAAGMCVMMGSANIQFAKDRLLLVGIIVTLVSLAILSFIKLLESHRAK